MGFADLPSGWAERPITDPDIFADVVDLVVTEQTRRDGALYLLLTHPDGRMLQPLALREVPPGAPAAGDSEHWRTVLAELAAQGACSFVAARARRGAPEVTADDDALFRVLLSGAAAVGLELHGRAIATPDGVLALGPDELPQQRPHPARGAIPPARQAAARR